MNVFSTQKNTLSLKLMTWQTKKHEINLLAPTQVESLSSTKVKLSKGTI